MTTGMFWGLELLLMEEILHLGWLKHYKYWDNHHPWWCRILSMNSTTQLGIFEILGDGRCLLEFWIRLSDFEICLSLGFVGCI